MPASSLEAYSQHLLELRKLPPDERIEELSSRGGLTAQFQPDFIHGPEAVVAAWLLERGDRARAAALILPRYEAVPDVRWLRWAWAPGRGSAGRPPSPAADE